MFRKGKRSRRATENPMPELRRRALSADPTEFGMEPTDRFPNVFGVVMDTAYSNGVATLVVFADGTTSLYTDTGFGIIGGGEHPAVVRSGRALLRTAEEHRERLSLDTTEEPPEQGMVTMRFLTYHGRLATTEREHALWGRGSALSPVFHAAQTVIAELRRIDEAPR